MCYREKESTGKKSLQFFKDLIPYLAELTPQVAIGGGEPFLYPKFIRDFSKEAKEYGLITNVTTNGTLPMKDYVKDVEMVSVSFDRWKNRIGLKGLKDLTKKIEQLKGRTRIGCNFLLDIFYTFKPEWFLMELDALFSRGIERIFALYPKNWKFIDVLKLKPMYYAPTFKYKHFYVDDLTNQILTENSYSNWKHPCHYGKSIISINEKGEVTGCSFSKTPVLTLDEPSDLMKIKDIKFKERYSCPYLKLK